eukprot:6467891-Amphidinium_carterae.1
MGNVTAETLGVQVHGTEGRVTPTMARIRKAWSFTMTMLSRQQWGYRDLAMLAGLWVSVWQIRRPTMATFDMVFRCLCGAVDQREWSAVCSIELLVGMALVPLQYIDWKRQVSETVVATDASQGGSGTVLSSGLSVRGALWIQQQLWTEELNAQGHIILVDLFAGIGAGRLALERLGIEVKVHIVIEDNVHALRVVAENFSDAVIVRGVRHLDLHALLDPVRMVDRETLVLILSGPPYMDADKMLRGRSCTQWIQWVRNSFQVQGGFARVEMGTELPDRMEDGMLAVWTRALDAPATFIDGSVWTQAYRRRWWMCTWPLKGDDHMIIEEFEGNQRCTGSPLWPPRQYWLKDGAELTVPTAAMPALTRGIRRQRKPQTEQSGTDGMHERWQADGFRFPLYQYHRDCMVLDGRILRPFVSEEREQLQGLEMDYTAGACTGAEKQNQQLAEDIRCNLIASCFHVATVMWIVGAVLYQHGYLCKPLTSRQVGQFFGGTGAEKDASLSSTLVRRLLLQLSHRGSDIRTLWRRLVTKSEPYANWMLVVAVEGWFRTCLETNG